MKKIDEKKYQIEDYKKGDFEEIIRMWESLGLGNKVRGDDEKVILKTLELGGKFYTLKEKQTNEIIGTSWITTDGRRLFLHHFGIRKDFQGKELSHFLLDKTLEFAKGRNMQIKLEVHKKNIIAQNLYKKTGFKYLGDYLVYIIRNVQNI